MIRYRIEFKRSAQKELGQLPRSVQAKILDAIDLLAVDPFSPILPIRKMAGRHDENRFRLRIADYRVIYVVYKKVVTVHVVRIGHRKDVYR